MVVWHGRRFPSLPLLWDRRGPCLPPRHQTFQCYFCSRQSDWTVAIPWSAFRLHSSTVTFVWVDFTPMGCGHARAFAGVETRWVDRVCRGKIIIKSNRQKLQFLTPFSNVRSIKRRIIGAHYWKSSLMRVSAIEKSKLEIPLMFFFPILYHWMSAGISDPNASLERYGPRYQWTACQLHGKVPIGSYSYNYQGLSHAT